MNIYTEYYKNGHIEYEGEWVNNMKNGKGIEYIMKMKILNIMENSKMICVMVKT